MCVECGKVAQGVAPRWRAYLTVDDHVVVCCPVCAEREFGEDEAL
jgi:hypothetical protein